MGPTSAALTIHFAPLIPAGLLYALAGAAALLLVAAGLKHRRGILWRAVSVAAFLLVLANPSLLEEEREPVEDVAVIVADRSPSQDNAERTERTDKVLAHLKKELEGRDGLDLRVIEAPSGGEGLARETLLFDALDQALADVPESRRAGVIFLTDGQIHDVPDNPEQFDNYGPVHGLLSGSKDEKDRQLVIEQAPAYGIVGREVTVRYRIEDTGNIGARTASVIIRSGNENPRLLRATIGEEQSFTFEIKHAGQNILEMETAPVDGEITEANNRAAVVINGVRDRLKVLLVSGQPHAGTRTWRDILTSDPGVDLIHFTILREPQKLDRTPHRELSLIPFPFQELFEVKLYDFDLIIFDRYKLNNIMPDYYFRNVSKYVLRGGAVLVSTGPDYAGPDSIFSSALSSVLPGTPTSDIVQKPFSPELTELGDKHPVTQDLRWLAGNSWGKWLRQISVAVPGSQEQILMRGADNLPLLILNRQEKGRVAQLASDHIWLWARGYDGGGPHAELLRRLIHWLMKEPELDEKALDIQVDDSTVTVRKRDLTGKASPISMKTPDGTREQISLEPGKNGWAAHSFKADQLGVYAFDDGEQTRFAIVGDLNPPELRGVRTTGAWLAPVIEASGGGLLWLAEKPQPDVKMLPAGRNYGGKNWIGLRRNGDYTVTGVKDTPVMPGWLAAISLLALTAFAWWREGRTKG